jgi:succinyl-diaminopimelate desuccinylase
MKGGIASILLALKAVLCETNEFNRGLTILFVSDEEAGCAEGMKYVTEKKKFSGQLVMTAEPTDLHIQGWFKGRAYYELETRGKAAHSSNPTLGVNAIHHMVDIIAKIKETGFTYETHKFLGRPVVNFSTIEGGPFWNTIPDFSRSKLEVRTVPGQTGEKVKEEIIKHFDELKQRNPTLQARVNVWDGWEVKEPMELPQTNPVYTRIQRASQKAIGRQLDPGMAGIGGPGDLQLAHKSDECINISKVVEAAKCYAAFILEFCV